MFEATMRNLYQDIVEWLDIALVEKETLLRVGARMIVPIFHVLLAPRLWENYKISSVCDII